jgi:hypothetical protein
VPDLVGDRAEGGARRWGGRRVLTGGDGGRCSTGWGDGGWRESSRGASERCVEARGGGNWGRGGPERGVPRRTESGGGWRSLAIVRESVLFTRGLIGGS